MKKLIQFLKKKYKDKPKWLKILDSCIPLPYLNLWLDTGVITIKTDLWREVYEDDYFVYIRCSVRLFWKWGFDFNLYRPN